MMVRISLSILLVVTLSGCGCNEDDSPFWDGITDTQVDPSTDMLTDHPVDTVYETPPVPDVTTDDICDEQDFDIHHEIVRLMLLLDQSSSMNGSPWNEATAALTALLENPAFHDMYFGLDAFPDGYPGAWSACADATWANPFPCMRCTEDSCGTAFEPQVPLLPQ